MWRPQTAVRRLRPNTRSGATEYFLPAAPQGSSRGIGGIFYDHHDSGDWDADFRLSRKRSARAFPAGSIPNWVRAQFSPMRGRRADREEQLIRRRTFMSSFNLLYDRGTHAVLV